MILDTSALSAFIDGDAAVGELLRNQARAHSGDRVGRIPLRHRAVEASRGVRSVASVRTAQFRCLARDRANDDSYAELRAALRRQGTPIPPNDASIAALALQHRLPVLSRGAHFDAVPRVGRQSW